MKSGAAPGWGLGTALPARAWCCPGSANAASATLSRRVPRRHEKTCGAALGFKACAADGRLSSRSFSAPSGPTCPPNWPLACPRPPRRGRSAGPLHENDSCSSRSAREAALAAGTSEPPPKLSFSGVRCAVTPSGRPPRDGSCSTPVFVSPNYLSLGSPGCRQVPWRYFWPDAGSIMRPSGEAVLCQLGAGMASL